MTRYFSTKNLVGFSIFATLLLFAFSGSHPTTGGGGYTGAPNDNVCTTCHSPGGGLDGTIEISGLPASVTPNTTYPLTVTVTNTAGSAVRAGFQMVSLKANLANGGTFSVPVSENNALVKTAAGKSYVGHQPFKNFSSNEAIFNVEWTAPASSTGDITVYGAAIIANGANGNSNDKFVATNVSVSLGGGGDPLTATFSNVLDAFCFDSNDGNATINAMGGSGNYMYNWDNGESNATAIMLSSGVHNVTISDDAGEEIVESVTIGAPSEIIPSIIFQTDAVCNGQLSGTAELSANGGTPGYSYNWGSGITGAIQNNLAAGNYLVTVTDLNNCTADISVFINQPDPIQINILSQEEPSCFSENDGMIIVDAVGGNGGFTYNWLDGIGVPSEGTLSGLGAGTYQVEVIDSEGCTNQISITLGEPDAVTATVTSTNVLCFGGNDGTATAAGEGGSGGYTYAWSNSGEGATQTGLVAGTYQVTVSDSEDCSVVEEIEITEPNTAVESGISVITQPNCGNQDGELSAFGLEGTPGYTYLWNDNTTSPVLSNIGSGIYTVTVSDMNNCTSVSMVTLEDNDGVTLAANNVENNICNGGEEGAATISASGGAGAYSFTWSNGGMNPTETGLPAGTYTITVTDEGNCTGEIMIEITEPDDFAANEVLEHISCNGAADGSIQLNATGGSGDLTYMWNTGDDGDAIIDLIPGIFRVTITDANSCTGEIEFVINEPDAIVAGEIVSMTPSCPEDMDGSLTVDPSGGTGELSAMWSNGESSFTASNLSAGDYSVTITDENNCEESFSFTLDDPTPLSIAESVTPPTCHDGSDGSATLSLIGGSGNYSIEWSTGDTTLTAMGLAAGIYTVTITDGNNCSNDKEIVVEAPLAINPNVTSTNESSNGANDGTASADPQDGLAPYMYNWSTEDTTQSIQDLAPGEYEVTITDANGCMVVGTAIINNGDCNITSTVIIQDISCFGEDDGSLSVELLGAVDPVAYLWSDDSTSPTLSDLAEGEYSVTITDSNNCQVQITEIQIMEPTDISGSDPVIIDASTSGSTDGSIDITFSGGTGELTFEYADGNGMPINIIGLESLATGTYIINVTDENGCQKSFGPFEVGVLSSLDDIDPIVANVYPNPARSFFIVETDSKLTSNPGIYSVTGQLITSTFERNLDRYTFDTSQLSNGVYYVKLATDTDIVLKKIIITK